MLQNSEMRNSFIHSRSYCFFSAGSSHRASEARRPGCLLRRMLGPKRLATKVEFGTAENLLSKIMRRGCDPTLLAVRQAIVHALPTGSRSFVCRARTVLDFVGKRVAVTGSVQTKKETTIFRWIAQGACAELAEREAASVVGTEVDSSSKTCQGSTELGSMKVASWYVNFGPLTAFPLPGESRISPPFKTSTPRWVCR